MGDHRAEVKVEMTLHGKTYKEHWTWINWDIYGGIDSRVREWFEECSADALARLDAEHEAGAAERIEAADRAEYERLKAKFDPSPTGAKDNDR